MKLPDGCADADMSVAEYVARAMLMEEIKHTKRDFEKTWAEESHAWIANAESAIATLQNLGFLPDEWST